jgi:peptidoglycan/LPS O-acetylase OafA/YrhL
VRPSRYCTGFRLPHRGERRYCRNLGNRGHGAGLHAPALPGEPGKDRDQRQEQAARHGRQIESRAPLVHLYAVCVIFTKARHHCGKMAKLQTPAGRLPLLDGLRGIAALGVAVYHIAGGFHTFRNFDRMYLFVDFFFILSGFVLSLAVGPKFSAGLTPTRFLKARAARLWPLVALGAILGAISMVPGASVSHIALLMALALAMVPRLTSPLAIFPVNVPQWSIMWELAANYLHAALLHRLTNTSLLMLAGIAGAAFLAAIYYEGWAGFGGSGSDWYWALPRIAWSYVLGVWMARIWSSGARHVVVSWHIALLLPVCLLFVLPGMPLSKPSGDALFCLVLAPLLFWSIACAHPPAWASPALRGLGAMSFPLYAVHIPVIQAMRKLTEGKQHDIHAVFAAILLAALIALFAPRAKQGWRALVGQLRMVAIRSATWAAWTTKA